MNWLWSNFLLPADRRCSVLVHHGGVGTTAVGLKWGKPTLVIAAFGDLFLWYALGISIGSSFIMTCFHTGTRSAAGLTAAVSQDESSIQTPGSCGGHPMSCSSSLQEASRAECVCLHTDFVCCCCAVGHTTCRGDVCHGLGVGPQALPLKGLTATQLHTGLRQLVHNPAYKAAAEQVAAGLAAEDGLEAALASVHRSLPGVN